MTDLMPNSAATSSPSRNGKNASEAIDAESIDNPSSLAFIAAILLLTTRLIWPAPMPRVDLSLTQTMAFDFTYFATRHANSRSSSSSGLGHRHVAHFEHPDVVFRREQRTGVLRDAGREDHLDELPFQNRGRGRSVKAAIERDDPAEGGSGVRAIREAVRVGDALRQRNTARIGMLHDDAGRCLELPHALECGIAVRDIVVRKLLPLDLSRLRDRGADGARIPVERRLLVGVLAIAQIALLTKRKIQIVRESRSFAADHAGKIGRHHGVVLRGVRKRFG